MTSKPMQQAEEIIEDHRLAPANRETAVKIDDVSMVFNMASEQLNNLKEYAVALVRRELRFKEFRALKNVSLEVAKGDVFGILGTNGSGKSTLLKIIAGVLEPTSGSIEVNGQIAPLIELGAGFDMDLTARENIYLNGALLGYSKKLIDENFDKIVDFAEIEDFLDIPIKNYSSGMVARVAFSIATVIVPDILVVDEVLSVGDFLFQQKCENRIRQLINEHHVTVLIVSHSNDQIERLCNKAAWLDKGTLKAVGDADQVCTLYRGLGGRTGSEASKECIWDILDRVGIEEKMLLSKCIEGTDPYEMNVSLVRASHQERAPEAVILAPTNTHLNIVLANSLSASLDAPVLATETSTIPPSVHWYLNETKPREITIVACGNDATAIIEQLSALPWQPTITNLAGTGDVYEYSLEIFEYGSLHHLWSDEAILIDYDDEPEWVPLLPYAYGSRCPVICFWREQKEEINLRALVEPLLEADIKQVRLLKNARRIIETENEAVLDVSLSTIATDSSPLETCLELEHMTRTVAQSNDAPSHAVIASSLSPQWIQFACLGGFVNKMNAAFYYFNPRNLDELCRVRSLLGDEEARPESLIFIGQEGDFSLTDRIVLESGAGE